jgi:hypothetical protein
MIQSLPSGSQQFVSNHLTTDSDAPPRSTGGRRRSSDNVITRKVLIDFYNQLSDGVKPTAGTDGSLVRKVKVDALRDALKNRGYLETTDTGGLTSNARKIFYRANETLFHGLGSDLWERTATIAARTNDKEDVIGVKVGD